MEVSGSVGSNFGANQQVAVHVEFQENRGVVGRLACCLWINTLETKLSKIKFIDEYIDNPDRVIFSELIIKSFRK